MEILMGKIVVVRFFFCRVYLATISYNEPNEHVKSDH